MRRYLLTVLLLLLFVPVTLEAQEPEAVPRPVTNAFSYRMGQGRVRNTYLAPLLYTGTDYSLEFERWRLQHNLEWVNWQMADLSFATGEDKGLHSSNWSGRIRYRYGVLHRWQEASSAWSYYVGPMLGTDVGFDYNLKMGGANNPATARITANVGAVGLLSYRFQQPRLQGLKVSLETQFPLLGAAFMPEFGSSYYETFYLRNTSHYVHFTSLHNQQDLDLRLVADVPMSLIPWFSGFDSVVRLGASFHTETMDINHIVTRYSSLQFVVGWVYEYLPFGRSRSNLLKRQVYEY